jgi:hypothetical protein
MRTDVRAIGLLAVLVGCAFVLLEFAYAYGGAPLVNRIIGPWGLAAAMSPFSVCLAAAFVFTCERLGIEP